jgi:hypothetical protein
LYEYSFFIKIEFNNKDIIKLDKLLKNIMMDIYDRLSMIVNDFVSKIQKQHIINVNNGTNDMTIIYNGHMLMNITLLDKDKFIDDGISIDQQFQKETNLRMLTLDEMVKFYDNIIRSNGYVVTNDNIYLIIASPANIIVYKANILDKCSICDCYSDIYELHLSLSNKDYPCSPCCVRCLLKQCHAVKQNDVKNVMRKQFSTYVTMNCDICHKSYSIFSDPTEKIYSSLEYNVDICVDCSKTERGDYLIKKYKMKENNMLFLSLNYTFGSFCDWIPLFVDDKENFVCKCLNRDNVYYGYYAFVVKNNCEIYEYTITNNIVLKKCMDCFIENKDNTVNIIKLRDQIHSMCIDRVQLQFLVDKEKIGIEYKLACTRKDIDLDNL